MKLANIWHWRSSMGWSDTTRKCFFSQSTMPCPLTFLKSPTQPIIILFFCFSCAKIFLASLKKKSQIPFGFYLYQLRSTAANRWCWWSHRNHVNSNLFGGQREKKTRVIKAKWNNIQSRIPRGKKICERMLVFYVKIWLLRHFLGKYEKSKT